MKRTLLAAAVATALGVTGVASAQSIQPIDASPNNITLRGGVALPVDASLSNVSNTFTDIGIDYNFNNSLIKGGDTYISIDVWFKDFSSVSAYPLAINQRFYTGKNSNGLRSYFFVGVGVTWVSVTDSTFNSISARGGIGTELGQNIIAELTGYISDVAGGTRANAITLDLGYRF